MEEPDKPRKFNLEERLIDFAILVIETTESMSATRAGIHIGGQLVRAGTSPALHYGEAQSAESRKDFIHKLKVLLKDLRESRVCLVMIKRTSLSCKMDLVDKALPECIELISIVVKSIETATKNLQSENRNKKRKKDNEDQGLRGKEE